MYKYEQKVSRHIKMKLKNITKVAEKGKEEQNQRLHLKQYNVKYLYIKII